MKPHVLIVEDEAILYDGLCQALKKSRYKVSSYIKSYDKAIAYLSEYTPDVALLDIDLQGDKDGLDLGKILNEKYNIPFIYVTKYDDDYTFNKGLQTCHQQYIVKTKPRLNIEDIVRAIETVLNRIEHHTATHKDYIFGLTAPLKKIKNGSADKLHRKAVKYSDIAFFSSDRSTKLACVPANYCWFMTTESEIYYLKLSLKDIEKEMPDYFIRIKDNTLINIKPDIFKGRRNGQFLKVGDYEFQISRRYQSALEEKMKKYYTQSTK